MKKYICIDIGGTSIKYGVLTESAEVITKSSMDTLAKEEGGHGILNKVKLIIKNYLEEFEVEGVCISTAGMVDPKEGKIVYALEHLIPNYTGMELKKEVEKEFNLRCEVENDVNCAGLGETWIGAGQGASSSVCLTIGTGIGGCVILDNKLINGFSNSAGEVGYIKVNGEDFQDLASTSSLVKRIAKSKNMREEDINGKIVFELAKKNDKICLEEIDKMINSLAIGISNICYVINPEVVILGGGIMAQEEYLKPKIVQALKDVMVERVYLNTRIEFAKKQNDAGMIGALNNFLNRC